VSKITFIIPAYNAAKTIRAAIESLASQTVPDAVECTVFDDCSKDETFAVLEELMRRYPFVKAFRNETNQGPGANRNKGIEMAGTEYLSFIDADDTLEKDWVETMLKAAEGRDLVVSGHKKVLPSGELVSEHHTAKSRLQTYTGSCWARLYRTDFIQKENIRFAAEYNTGEDMMFVMGASSKAKNAAAINYLGYNYTVFETSLSKANTRGGIQDKLDDLLKVIRDVKAAIKPEDMYGRGALFNVMAFDIIMYGMKTPSAEQFTYGVNRITASLSAAFPGWEKQKRAMGMSWKLRLALRFFKPPLLFIFAKMITGGARKSEQKLGQKCEKERDNG
jgi:glycosyltransferase involved in cell wall biosynthesis